MNRKNIRRKIQGSVAMDELNIRDKDGDVDIIRLRNPAQGIDWFDDFLGSGIGDGGSVAGMRWTKQDTSAAGAPTWGLVANTHGGEFNMILASTNEAESLTLYFGDQLIFDATKKTVIQFRVKVTTITSAQRVVFGLASARNATLDNIVVNGWFRLEANMNVLVETDDGTTDNDDNDTTVDAVAGTYAIYEIDLSKLANVKFRVNGVDVTPETMDLSALTTQTLQPFVEIQKDSGTGVPGITLDWAWPRADR